MRNHEAIQIINPKFFKIVLKLDRFIPQFDFTIKLQE